MGKTPECSVHHKIWQWKIDEIISPQTMLVDGVQRHVKDVSPCCAFSTLEDNEEDNIQFDPDLLLPLWVSSEILPTKLEEGMIESAGGDGGRGEKDGNEEVMPLILRRSTR